jgi:uncharacterized membrane protein
VSTTATRTGIFIGAILALTGIVFGFWAFVFVAVAMAIGALVGRIIEGKLSVSGLVDAFRGKRSSS